MNDGLPRRGGASHFSCVALPVQYPGVPTHARRWTEQKRQGKFPIRRKWPHASQNECGVIRFWNRKGIIFVTDKKEIKTVETARDVIGVYFYGENERRRIRCRTKGWLSLSRVGRFHICELIVPRCARVFLPLVSLSLRARRL